ncbi:hypothetical protein D3C85_1466330 [compost metagenome]
MEQVQAADAQGQRKPSPGSTSVDIDLLVGQIVARRMGRAQGRYPYNAPAFFHAR